MKNLLSVLAVVCSILPAACQTPPVDVAAEGEVLMRLSRDWSDLAATGDVDTIMTHWAEDAKMLPPGMPVLAGKDAIRSYVEAAMAMPGFAISWEPISVQVASSGDMAYMLERNTVTANDSLGNPVTTYGKVVTVWRKDAEGTWKNVIDMWNGTPPPEN